MSDRWFYQLFNEEFGPAAAGEIHELIADSTLGSQDLVREEGAELWITVEKFQQLSQSGGDGEMEEFADLSELDLWSGGEDGGLSEAAVVPEHEEDAEELQCYCESHGQIMGPMSLFDLIRLADAGTLGDSDRVRLGQHGDWVLPMDIPELAAALFSFDVSDDDVADSADDQDTSAATTESPDSAEGEKQRQRSDKEAARPVKKRRRPDAGVTSKQKTSPGRKKRRKRKKRDELLEEIFSEVFTSDGKLKPEHEAADSSAATYAVAAASVEQPVAPEPKLPASEPQNHPEETSVMSNAGVPPELPPVPSPPTPMQSAIAQTAAAVAPPPTPPKKRSSGKSLSLPSGKTLGVAGGGLVAVLLVAGILTGMVSLPGFGPDPQTVLSACAEEYRQLSSGAVTKAEWQSFNLKHRPSLREVLEAIGQLESPTAEDKQHQSAAIEFAKLLNCKAEDEDKRSEAFTSFLQKFGS